MSTMLEIPPHQHDTFRQLTGIFYPEVTTTAPLVFDLFPEPSPKTTISTGELNRYAVAELIFLQAYFETKYENASPGTVPDWVTTFTDLSAPKLSDTVGSPEKSSALHRQLTRQMFGQSTTEESLLALSLLQNATAARPTVGVVGSAARHIMTNLVSQPAFSGQFYPVREQAVWGAFGPWAAQKLAQQYKDDFTRGVHSEHSAQVREAYVFLVPKLVEAGYAKAYIARLLSISEKSVYNMLEA